MDSEEIPKKYKDGAVISDLFQEMLRFRNVLKDICNYVDNNPESACAADCAIMARQAIDKSRHQGE